MKPSEKGLEYIWQGSQSLGASAQVLAGELFGTGSGGYSSWMSFDEQDMVKDDPLDKPQVKDDPRRHDYNVDVYVDNFVRDALEQANHTKTDHQLWALGSDFMWQNADHWYRNLDKLIHYVNLNGTVNAFYSTPSIYAEQKKKSGVQFEVRQDDVFPLADNPHHYWSGFFTSRPSLKRQVRFATNLLTSARQLEVIASVSAAEIGLPTDRPSPKVGDSWSDSLEGAVGLATHHDGMSGTARQDVSDDYAQRISESSIEVEAGISVGLQKMLGMSVQRGGGITARVNATTAAAAAATRSSARLLQHCNCNTQGDCLNISVCSATTTAIFTVVAWNPRGHNATQVLRLPVAANEKATRTFSVTDGEGKAVSAQLLQIDERTASLHLL
jgi:alpha-mannosidase